MLSTSDMTDRERDKLSLTLKKIGVLFFHNGVKPYLSGEYWTSVTLPVASVQPKDMNWIVTEVEIYGVENYATMKQKHFFFYRISTEYKPSEQYITY